MKELSERIFKFIETYAKVSSEYNGSNTQYTNPDVRSMILCAEMLAQGKKPKVCFSSWRCSGGYEPKASKEGKAEHDELVNEIYRVIDSTC